MLIAKNIPVILKPYSVLLNKFLYYVLINAMPKEIILYNIR